MCGHRVKELAGEFASERGGLGDDAEGGRLAFCRCPFSAGVFAGDSDGVDDDVALVRRTRDAVACVSVPIRLTR
eukprot:m.153735 g.153735  ORF g.153735 m.153735 type:complete len:74 (-) comp16241_c0_seq1:103-324(-)